MGREAKYVVRLSGAERESVENLPHARPVSSQWLFRAH